MWESESDCIRYTDTVSHFLLIGLAVAMLKYDRRPLEFNCQVKKIPQAVNIITSFIVVGVSGRGLDIHIYVCA